MTAGRTSTILVVTISLANILSAAGSQRQTVTSPEATISVTVRTISGRLEYRVDCAGGELIPYSPLGIVRADQGFTNNLELIEATKARHVDETYTMPHGKRRICRDRYNESILKLRNAGGARLELVIRAYDDGAAFRYRFPENSDGIYTVTNELTGFQLPAGGKVWLCPYDKATKYTPSGRRRRTRKVGPSPCCSRMRMPPGGH